MPPAINAGLFSCLTVLAPHFAGVDSQQSVQRAKAHCCGDDQNETDDDQQCAEETADCKQPNEQGDNADYSTDSTVLVRFVAFHNFTLMHKSSISSLGRK